MNEILSVPAILFYYLVKFALRSYPDYMRESEDYANIILNDERDKIVTETPTVYEDDQIERIYEFDDGAVVKYEWQSTPDGRTSPDGKYNHRFTLEKLPASNPGKLKKGIIKVINYPA